MTELRTIPDDDLRALVTRLDAAEDPLPLDRAGEFVAMMGWVADSRLGGSTGLPVNQHRYSLGELNGLLARCDLHVTDLLNPRERKHHAMAHRAMPRLEAVLTEVLGPPSGTPWAAKGTVWDRPDGRQIRLLQGRGGVSLAHWWKVRADLDRAQQRLGVDPDRDIAQQLTD